MPSAFDFAYGSGNAYYAVPMATSNSATDCMFTWATWNQDCTCTSVNYVTGSAAIIWDDWRNQYQETLAQRAERERVAAEIVERQLIALAKARAEEAAAQARAEALLLENLDQTQAAEFKKSRQFVVHVKDKDKDKNQERRYLVKYGFQSNVKLLDEKTGQPVAGFCIHPPGDFPVPDIMLAQKLLLECDEKEFLRIANRRAA